MDIVQVITPILNVALVAILGYLGKEVVKIVSKLAEFIVAKIGLTNYTKAKTIAEDIFNKVEEDGRIGKLANSKIAEFEKLIKVKIPGITDSEIELLRQAIAGEFNKDKPTIVQAIDKPVQEVTVKPTIIYKALDGTELQPVNNIITQ